MFVFFFIENMKSRGSFWKVGDKLTETCSSEAARRSFTRSLPVIVSHVGCIMLRVCKCQAVHCVSCVYNYIHVWKTQFHILCLFNYDFYAGIFFPTWTSALQFFWRNYFGLLKISDNFKHVQKWREWCTIFSCTYQHASAILGVCPSCFTFEEVLRGRIEAVLLVINQRGNKK